MKPRLFFVLVLVVAVAGGLAWWLQQPAAAETGKVAAMPHDGTTGLGNTSSLDPKSTDPTTSGNSSGPVTLIFKQEVGAQPSGTVAGSSANRGVTVQSTANPGNKTAAKGIHFAISPAGAAEYLAARLPIVNRSRQGMPTDNFELEPPLPLDSLDLSVFADGGSMAEALSSAAESLGTQNPRLYYIVDVAGLPVQGMFVSLLSSGDFAGGSPSTINFTEISAGLKYLAGLDAVRSGSYEPHLFEFSAFVSQSNGRVQAIWLRSDAGGPDLIYTLETSAGGLHPVPSSISPNTLFTVDEFRAAVSPIVKQQIADRNAAIAARQAAATGP